MTQCYKNHMESPRVNLDLRLEDELLTTTGAYKTKGNRNHNFLKLKTLVCGSRLTDNLQTRRNAGEPCSKGSKSHTPQPKASKPTH